MRRGVAVLWIEALVLLAGGLALYGWPSEAGAHWPWVLPPLAARFIGASFLGVASGAASTAGSLSPGALVRNAVTGIGLLLAVATGVLAPASEVEPTRLVALGTGLGAIALAGIFIALHALRSPAWTADMSSRGWTLAGPRGLPRSVIALLVIHLLAVIPVGLTMFLVPGTVATYWPWKLSLVNVRLVGSIFVASIPVSGLALAANDRDDVRPTLGVYAVFATLALGAVAVHASLFDPNRVATWAFVALYVFIALGSAMAFVGLRTAR
jgi:hypothetical protein